MIKFVDYNLKSFTMKAEEIIKIRQLEWAKRKGIEVDKKYKLYCKSVKDNIFKWKDNEGMEYGLFEDAKKQFMDANGNELNDGDSPAKMRALLSSSALCVNVFQYLLRNDMLSIISDVLDLEMEKPKGTFEEKFAIDGTDTGKRFPANLDFVIKEDNKLIAIESKFTEPYGRVKKNSRLLRQSYLNSKSREYEFEINRFTKLKDWINKEWKIEKYNKGKNIARLCPYEYLDAAQLIKHLLGLSSESQMSEKGYKNYKLCYLYYCIDSKQMAKHSIELNDFQTHLDKCINFEAMSYQEFFQNLKQKAAGHEDYLNYMKERYWL